MSDFGGEELAGAEVHRKVCVRAHALVRAHAHALYVHLPFAQC